MTTPAATPAAPAPAAPAAPAPAAPAAPAPAAPAAAAPAAPAAPADPAAPAAPAAAAPPATYTLKAPEGYVDFVDDQDIVRVTELAKAEGWSNEEAQTQLERYAQGTKAQSDAWLAELRADREYGGEKLAAAQARARSIIDRVRPPDHPRRDAFLRIIDKTGYGNHIEVLSFLADLGRMAAEDSPALSSQAGAAQKDPASVLYPTSST